MPRRESPSLQAARLQSICLDYGADETTGNVEFDESEIGFLLTSRWQFSIGTELALDCAWRDARLGARRFSIEGIVVCCKRRAEAGYATTVFLLDLPDATKECVREFSRRDEVQASP